MRAITTNNLLILNANITQRSFLATLIDITHLTNKSTGKQLLPEVIKKRDVVFRKNRVMQDSNPIMCSSCWC